MPRPAATDGPWRITFVTNPDDCNLHCIMCDGHSELARLRGGATGPHRRMDVRLVERVLSERRGTALREIIPSTMGEPLLYPEMDALVALCAASGVRLNLTTNGTFPGRGAARWAEALVPVTSDVKISWNGATAATAEALMRGISFREAQQAVKDFVAVRDAHAAAGGNRCRVTFQVTVMEPNVAELPGIVRLAALLGVDRVKANQLWIHFDELGPLSLRRSSEAISRWNAAVRAVRRAADLFRLRSGAEVELQNFVEFAPDPVAPAPRGECPFLGREAWVTVDGRFAPCPAPGASRGRLGEFGSLEERTLGDIWASRALRQLRKRWLDHPACRECNMRRPGGA